MSNIESYVQAKADFEKVEGEVQALAEIFAAVANALRSQPDRMGFSNTVAGLPLNAFGRDAVTVNADDWRNPEQIMALLTRYHQAKDSMETLWNSMPPQMQSALQPPKVGGNAHRSVRTARNQYF